MDKYILGILLLNIICCIGLYYIAYHQDKKYEMEHGEKTIANRVMISIIIVVALTGICTSFKLWNVFMI